MATKVKGVHLKGAKGSGPIVGQTTAVLVEGTGQDGGYAIPRYKADGFKMRFNPYPGGMIRAHIGAKLAEDGVIYYPASADVDPVRAAKVQALMDYNNALGRKPMARKDMIAIYGKLYTNEFERLKTARNGPSPWRKK